MNNAMHYCCSLACLQLELQELQDRIHCSLLGTLCPDDNMESLKSRQIPLEGQGRKTACSNMLIWWDTYRLVQRPLTPQPSWTKPHPTGQGSVEASLR